MKPSIEILKLIAAGAMGLLAALIIFATMEIYHHIK